MRLMKIILVTMAMVFCFGLKSVNCREAEREKAREIAESWIAERFSVERAGLYESQEDQLISTDIERNSSIIAYVFEIEEGGFVLVASDDKMGEIIAYSETNKFDRNIPAMKEFLDAVYQVMSEDSVYTRQEDIHHSGSRESGRGVEYLLETQWGQSWPYNNYCPTTYEGDACSEYTLYYAADGLYHSDTPAGCVATAMGQIMRYHKYPPQGVGENEYLWESNCITTTIYANFEVNYDWDNMPGSLNANSPEAQYKAVAALLFHCGVAVEMDYETTDSGAHSAEVNDALGRYFDYSTTAEYLGRDLTTEEWFSILSEEITNNRPVYYAGGSSTGRHAFVLDGVSTTEPDGTRGTEEGFYVHLNYGWGGGSDGWYDINFFYVYTLDHYVIIGISPRSGGGGIPPNAPSSPGAGKPEVGLCFVATEAYGTPFAGEVKILSKFRDDFLLKNTPGRLLVRGYYEVSPRIARSIRNRPSLRKLIRWHLKPIVFVADLFVLDDAD